MTHAPRDTDLVAASGDALTTPFSLSVLTATKGHASKTILAGANGQPVKHADSLAIWAGMLQHVQVPGLEGLQALLQHVRPNQALVHGIVKDSRPGHSAPLVTKDKLALAKPGTLAPGTIARTQDFLAYPPDVFLLMFDRDDTPEDPTTGQTAEELLAVLAPLFPGLEHAGVLITTSTSSGIRDKQTQAWLLPPTGSHSYFLATGNLARFVDLLKVRLWTAGYGFCKLATPNAQTGVAAVLERAVVDLLVFSPERLDYVAGARIAKDAPFYQDRGAPRLIAGSILDLDAFPDVTPEERRDYETRLAAAKATLAPARFRLVTQVITADDPTLPAPQVEALALERLERQDGGELPADFLLYFYHRKKAVAVQDLSAHYDGKRLADPAEPTYRDGTDAVLHWHGGRWRINSWAHGILKTYRRARPAAAAPATSGAPSGMSPQQQRFQVSEQGVWYRPEVDALGNQPADIWVCDALWIVAATRDLDNDNHGNLLTFRDKHGHPQTWAMPLELLEEQREYRKVLRRKGLRINGAARAQLQLYLDIWHSGALARCVDRVGWHNNAYVLPDATLGDPGAERLVLQTLDSRSEGYRHKGTLASWKREVAARCVGNSRLLLAVSTAFAAALLALVEEESGGLHFRGPSSTGKTTTMEAGGTVWGEPSRLERWRATANALEGVALAHNDNLLCLDELKELDPREAGGVAYMLANGAGKRRGQPYGGARPRLTWRLLFLSTGETSLEQHMADAGQRIRAGQEVRLVDVPADAGAGMGLFEQLHGCDSGQAFADQLREAARQHYGQAGRAFVTILAQDRAAHRDQVRTLMAAFVARVVPAAATGQVARVAQRFALIAAAGELATVFSLTGWPEGEAFAAAQRCFGDWLAQRGSVDNADEIRALAQVKLFFEQYGTSRFLPWTLEDGETCQRCLGTGKVDFSYMQGMCFTCHGVGKITADHPTMRLVQARAGWAHATEDGRTEFFVLPEVFRKEIAQGFETKWMARLLGTHGYLLASSQGKWLRSERIPGLGKTSVYRVTADLLGAAVLSQHNNEEGGEDLGSNLSRLDRLDRLDSIEFERG